jgi:signal transduction histidine kinase
MSSSQETPEQLRDMIKDLQDKIRILQNEYEGLLEQVEESFLLRVVSEKIDATTDPLETIQIGLEQISLLKDIPFCSYWEIHERSLCLVCQYRSNLSSVCQSVSMPLEPLLQQSLVSMHPELVRRTENPSHPFILLMDSLSFPAEGVLHVPGTRFSWKEGFYLFADHRSGHDLQRIQDVLPRVTERLSTRVANLRLMEELRRMNEQLDRKVSQRTKELQETNQALQREMEERKRTFDQLLQAQKMESIGRLAGGVAHDFNNMLQAILGNTELGLAEVEENDPAYPMLMEIRSIGLRASELPRQLLAFARKQESHPAVINPNAALEGLFKMLQRLLPDSIEFRFIPDSDIPNIEIDPVQFDQMIANLVVNARDAISGKGSITISTGKTENPHSLDVGQDKSPEEILIRISDTGCGIDPSIQEHIFEPFFTTKTKGAGTGLGLSTVFGIVQQNHGTIELRSEIGKGSEFIIRLPASGKMISSSGSIRKNIRTEGKGKSILLVEDDPSIRKILSLYLGNNGFSVTASQDGLSGLETAKDYPGIFDLLITDMMMPGMDGESLAAEIRRMGKVRKVILLTGYSSGQRDADPATVCLQKPFHFSALKEAIEKLLK